jgi:hypothetical protein
MSDFSIAAADAAEVIFETIGESASYVDAGMAEAINCTVIPTFGVQLNTGYDAIVEPIDTFFFRLAEIRPRVNGRVTLNNITYCLVELIRGDETEQEWQVRQL